MTSTYHFHSYHGFHIDQSSHRFRTILLLLLTVFILSFQPQQLRAATVITTLPPLASLVTWLDPKLDVNCLLPRNADPHHFQLTPRQVESLQQGQLLIRSSVDDGHWPSLHSSIPTLDLWPIKQALTHQHEHEHKHENQIPIINHNWLNPQAVSLILPKLAKQLIQHFPEHQSMIETQLKVALAQSQALWLQWQSTAQSQGWQHKGVIMQHPSWRTLFKALDIPIRAILESEQHGHEYGPKKLEKALQILQQHPQTLLIADKNHSNRTLLWLQSHHTSSPIISLDALGSCKQTWPALMVQNLNLLKQNYQHE
ncbi:MAG: metal ABC transporter substrate-binding protein [Mariprofundaceae bacterium]